MFEVSTLKNKLTLITIPLPHLDSVTTLVAVGAGSRYETRKSSGISHFLEHMFFKGSQKYPSAEEISTLVDSIGAINNAGTDREITDYWVKSSAKYLDLSADILSSMLKDPLLKQEEIEREKGVIIEEMKMYEDDPSRHIWDLYTNLQFGDQPLGWDVIGTEKVIKSLNREDFLKYMNSLYVPENMALVFAGKLPDNIIDIAEKYFGDLTPGPNNPFVSYKPSKQDKPKINLNYKKTDQAHLILGTIAYDRYDIKRYAAKVLSAILGGGMSSRLFLQVRERRGLAYYVTSVHEAFKDSGFFAIYGGLKLEKLDEALKVIKDELDKMKTNQVSPEELKKAKEMIRGRLAIRSESTNFLAENFGLEYVLDRRLESFDEYLAKIDEVNEEDIMEVAKELFRTENYNLEIISPLKNSDQLEKILLS